MSTTTITTKGQITIPKDIRQALALQTGDQVIFVLEGNKAIMYPSHQRSLMQLQGALSATQNYTDHQTVRETIAQERGQIMLEEGSDE
ncbi:MAG: AbrB/MazE/SpoVT family DNA-binding domain-containing protein [Chloroflexi bacterium]|nr:AbrB/MazE/SpoVT family DNA-binding domain-containing protein [Ardenticatenaceae bacterium]MBL1131459.1 AbrB/MazE/SpoVT family DNA-binding domain-containing protein [Chloroflexota bacterium]NOG37569.1 AbrB/MazE/SpoVT family DNA-binding domain-containing protein [Chloroflexota bacterium]GIK56203.1 MAG: hypothetical protein BroJett015_18660 [Chloroflexota bacterium]